MQDPKNIGAPFTVGADLHSGTEPEPTSIEVAAHHHRIQRTIATERKLIKILLVTGALPKQTTIGVVAVCPLTDIVIVTTMGGFLLINADGRVVRVSDVTPGAAV